MVGLPYQEDYLRNKLFIIRIIRLILTNLLTCKISLNRLFLTLLNVFEGLDSL